MGTCNKTCPEFYIINPYMSSDCELHCTRDRNVGYHEKYMNSGNTGIFTVRRIVYAALHTHMKTAAQPVYILSQATKSWPKSHSVSRA